MKRKHFMPHPRSGFTLIESVITMAIVALAFISTVTLMTFSRIHNDLEQERARAHQVVSEELEEIRRDLYTYITSGRTVTVWDNGTPDDTADDTTGTLEVIARDPAGNLVVAAPSPAVRLQVEVTLTWNPRGRLGNKTMRESLMTYLAP